MSSRLQKSKHFVLLLLKASKPQARALLETADPNQVLALSEIALNLFQNPAFLAKLKKQNKRRQSILKNFGDKHIKEKAKYQLLCKHWEVIWKCVLTLKQFLNHSLS